jgi:hypothetical protein
VQIFGWFCAERRPLEVATLAELPEEEDVEHEAEEEEGQEDPDPESQVRFCTFKTGFSCFHFYKIVAIPA